MTVRPVPPADGRAAPTAPVVVKLGGRTFEEAASRRRLAAEVAEMARRGERVVVVHGGGAAITAALAEAGVEPTFVRGLRVTDERTLAVVDRVLGALGQSLARDIADAGAPAVALGRAARVLEAVVKEPALGRVGAPAGVDAHALHRILDGGLVPVVAPVGVDRDGEALNVNADEAAAAVAVALGARALVLMTDVDGVLGADGRVVSRLVSTEALALVSSGVARGGMVPKLEGALATLAAGVGSVRIVPGARPGVLSALARGESVGTELVLR